MNLWLNGSVGILSLQVSFEHGIEILKVLKGHSSKTSILDDFEFYEGRQKIMQEKKTKQRLLEKQVNYYSVTIISVVCSNYNRIL